MASFFNSGAPSILSYRDEYQPTYLDAPPMDRSSGSRSSMSSSNGSNLGQSNGSSPGSSYCPSYGSSSGDYMTPRGASPYVNQNQTFSSSTAIEGNFRGGSPLDNDLPPFDPEKEGDPRIAWQMYYNFEVTKAEAYWQLKPGYVVSESYPDRVKSDPINIKVPDSRKKVKTEKRHPCCTPGCKAKPFTRHYDLERHFGTVHGSTNDAKVEMFLCDYAKCQHVDPLRKDHCREHYREFHMEDLVKRGSRQDNTESTLWWERRNISNMWWRCCRCLQRMRTTDGWRCKKCNQQCELERQTARKKLVAESMDEEISSGFSTAFSDPAGAYITPCFNCEQGWIYHENTERWEKCQICQNVSYMI